MSDKITLRDIPSDYLWRWLQDLVANKYKSKDYGDLTEMEKRDTFAVFTHMLNDICEKDKSFKF